MAEILLSSIKMADRQNHSLKPLPMANYSSAVARAVEWLGDRYLLAKPINVSAHRGAAKPVTVGVVA
jgi:1,6-anhydro-N-acetylmuramate kinase